MRTIFSSMFRNKDETDLKRAFSRMPQEQMDESRKARTRALLSEYMAMRPIRSTEKPIIIRGSRRSFLSATQMYAIPVTAVVLVFGLTAGTAFAAEGTLPGDLLYPVKVHVNEEIKTALLTSPQAQANWQVERAARRLEEASTLAIQGKLTPENRAVIETNLADHVSATEKSADTLVASNDFIAADEVGAHLHAVLRAHGDILASVLPEVDQSATSSDPLLADVVQHLDSASRISTESQTALASSTSDIAEAAAEQRSVAEAHIASVRSYIESSAASHAAPELVARAHARLRTAEQNLDDGSADLTRGATSTALTRFSSALSTALDAEASLSAQSHLLNISLGLAASEGTDGDATAGSVPEAHPTLTKKPAATLRRAAALRAPAPGTTTPLEAPSESSENSSRSVIIRSVIDVLLHGTASSTDTRLGGDSGRSSESDNRGKQDSETRSSDSGDSGVDLESQLGL